ncbi:hypothetical protein O3M35_005507 [Rhynocoris fuscipes]|uniref:Uncharacterized protein n=1 Tax=Rhynocoris fuscipes TaxID=488301 RepID=A0AAW1DQZ4_9HEMI
MWILDNFDIHHIRHINSGGISQGDANKLGGYYNSKYNEENLPGEGYYHFPNTITTQTKDVGETTVAQFKKKIIGSRSRFVIKWNPKCDTIDSPDILVESDTAGKFFNNIKAHRAPPLLYIRPFNAEHKNENIVDGTQMFVSYITCRVRTYYRLRFSGRLYNQVV